MPQPKTSDELAAHLSDVLQQPKVPEKDLLSDSGSLVAATNAWAVGLWRKSGEQLELIRFGTADGFDPQVAAEFQEATRRVPLDQTQLGIVNAIVHNRPALARATELTGDLRKSAGWLGRFGAHCSLSCPVRNSAGEPVAVFAVSWADLYEEDDDWPRRLKELADKIAEKLPQGS